MPLANHRSEIPRLAKDLGNRHSPAQLLPARLIAVQPRQQTYAGRVTLGSVIELGKAKPTTRERIQIRSANLRPVTT